MSEDPVKCNTQVEEDDVWIDLLEVNRNCRTREIVPFKNNKDHLLLENRSSNIVQSIFKEEVYDPNSCDSDLLLEEEILEAEYINQCSKLKSEKLKYPNVQKLKIQERGIFSVEKRQNVFKDKEKQCKGKKNQLLPKTKLDAASTQILEMLINNRYLGQFHDVVGTGRNSIVFHAYCSENNCITMPFNNAVKVYKITKDEARNNMIYKRVQREFEHLNILGRSKFRYQFIGGVKAINNVIVISFIGCDEPFVAAPTIEEMASEHDQAIYNAIIAYMDECYNLANLVHGKLSAKKILCWWRNPNQPCFVGWSHSLKKNHPMALTKLMKDCQFVTEFYKRRGVAVKPTIEIFKQVTRQNTVEEKLIKIIEGKNLYEKYNTNPNRNRCINLGSTRPITNKRFK